MDILAEISIWIIVVPLIIGGYNLLKLSPDSLLVFGVIVSAAVPQLFRAFHGGSVMLNISYNLYTPVEFILLFILFFSNIKKKCFREIFYFTFAVFFGSLILAISFFGLANKFISELVCIANILYCLWILLIILEQYGSDSFIITFRKPFFWYMAGVFLYAPCTLLIFSLWNYIKKNPDSFLNNLWIIHHVFNILMYLMFSVGLIKDRCLKK